MMKKFFLFILCISSLTIISNKKCVQEGNRLSSFGDTKDFNYVDCSCDCDQYKKINGKQCSQCKHFHTRFDPLLQINPWQPPQFGLESRP